MANFQVVLGLFTIALFVGNTAARCPLFYEQVGEKCYWNLYAKITYDEAVGACEASNARVVVLRSQAELEELNDWMFDKRGELGLLWIGCDDRKDEGSFVCLDNEPVNPDIQWAGKNPDNGQNRCTPREEDCVSVNYRGGLRDRPCEFKAYAVCEAL